MAFSFRVNTSWCHDFPKLARESGFYFNMHRSRIRIDWNRLSAIDIDRIIKERDFSTVDQNINNVIDYCLESEYDVKILDSSFVKLFRLAQLAVEYLLYCKQYLDHSVVILKDELRSKIEENVKLKRELAGSEDNVKHLKEQLKEKCKLLESKISKTNGEVHKCPYCPKTFVSALFVTAHVTRRHSYISDLCFPSSPVHDLYRAETEKLHSEIKTLKERLNQTERVIGKGSEEINTDMRLSKLESKDHSSNVDTNDIIKEQGKMYQAEINSLKSILFYEIHNLRQKDNNVHKLPENTSDSGLNLLMSQQEKEIQRLREQLLERVTPDIESMHSKLQVQENFWRSKIEHLELQHNRDIQNLTMELKETQESANRTKSEYESKVMNLEKQSMNQSNILTEQRKQLNSLTREINNSQIQLEQSKDTESLTLKKSSEPVQPDEHDPKRYKKVTDVCGNAKSTKSAENANIVVQDIDSVDSQESTNKLTFVAPKHQYVAKNSWDTNTVQVNPRKHVELYGTNTDRTRNIEISVRHIKPITKLSEVHKNKDDRQVNRSLKLSKHSSIGHPRVGNVNSIRKSCKSRLDNSVVSPALRHTESIVREHELHKHCFDPKKIHTTNDSDEDSSRITSESSTLDSESETDEHSGASIENDAAINDQDKNLSSSSSAESIQQEEAPLVQDFSVVAREGFNKKLMDLGINPEWEGIPKATFQQKIELVKHHQNINAKKFPKYNQIKSKVLEQIASRISANQKIIQDPKNSKKSPLDKFVTNVKSKAVKAFSAQKDSIQHKSTATVKSDACRRISLKQKTDHPPTPSKRNTFKSASDSPVLLSDRNEANHRNVPETMVKYKGVNYVVCDKSTPDKVDAESSYFPRSPKRATYTVQHVSTPIKKDHDAATVTEPWSNLSSIKQVLGLDKTETSRCSTLKNNDMESLITDQESVLTPFISPKNNKSVLKSATGCVGSLVKKKVLFDLDSRSCRKFLTECSSKRMELNDSDWNISSISDERENVLKKERSLSADNIVLKTTQSDKIAEISKKIEEQLRISRQKPVGAVEAMFLSKPPHSNGSNENVQAACSKTAVASSVNVQATSIIVQESPIKPRQVYNPLPQPAPRSSKQGNFNARDSQEQLDINDFDLDTDIDEILQA